MPHCLICQTTTKYINNQCLPGYRLCRDCQAAGYKLTLGGELDYCIMIPSSPPVPSWMMRCAVVARLLRQENIPAWLGSRARRNPHPPKKKGGQNA